jgi:hypothetical protein
MSVAPKRGKGGKAKPAPGLFARLRGHFLAGLLVTSPAALT